MEPSYANSISLGIIIKMKENGKLRSDAISRQQKKRNKKKKVRHKKKTVRRGFTALKEEQH